MTKTRQIFLTLGVLAFAIIGLYSIVQEAPNPNTTGVAYYGPNANTCHSDCFANQTFQKTCLDKDTYQECLKVGDCYQWVKNWCIEGTTCKEGLCA